MHVCVCVWGASEGERLVNREDEGRLGCLVWHGELRKNEKIEEEGRVGEGARGGKRAGKYMI